MDWQQPGNFLKLDPENIYDNPAKYDQLSAWVILGWYPARANNLETYVELKGVYAKIRTFQPRSP